MEGYLFKKGRGESKLFGRKNWKKRWCILEGQYLTYYEDFDLEKKTPVNKKGVAIIGGCEITVVPHQERKFCFVVKHSERSPLFLCADKEKLMQVWIKALINAANGVGGPTNFNFDEYYDLLSIDKSEELTTSSLNKAYRKAALKNHPDKGGNVDAFKKIQEAFEILQSKLADEEKSKYYKTIGFSAEIEKGPQSVGFGMTVVEDTKKGAIIIKDVFPTMIMRSISDESGGKIEKGDRIIGLDNDDIRTWTLARVVQRLTDIRAPIGVVVNFSFSRVVRIDGKSDNDEPEQEGTNEEEKYSQSQRHHDDKDSHSHNHSYNDNEDNEEQEQGGEGEQDEYGHGQSHGQGRGQSSNYRNSVRSDYASADIDEEDYIPPEKQQRSSVFSNYTSADIDEDDFVPPPTHETHHHRQPPQQPQQQQRPSVFSEYASADIDEDDFVPPPQTKSEIPKSSTQKPFQSEVPTQPKVSKAWEMDPMVELASLKSENEHLHVEVNRLTSLLAAVTKERDVFLQEANEFRMRFESAESERMEFLKQLSEVEVECQQLERREKDALQLLEKLSEQGKFSAQQSAELENNIRMGAKAAQSGELYSDFDRGQNYDSVKLAETAAFRSVSYVDPTGHLQEKFAQQDLGKNFLKKLESSVVRQYGNSSAYHSSSSQERDEGEDSPYHPENHHTGDRKSLHQHQHQQQQSQQPQSHHRESSHAPFNGRQKNGTHLYQAQKMNLKPVNRPSMNRKNNEEIPPRNSSKSQIHSPIKTQRSGPTTDTSETAPVNNRHRISGGGPNDGRFQHLLQPTASSSNRLSRPSQITRNNSADGDEPPQGRNRSPRRSDLHHQGGGGGGRNGRGGAFD